MRLVTLARGPSGQSGALIGEEVLDFAMASRVIAGAALIPSQTSKILEYASGAYNAAAEVVASVMRDEMLRDKLRMARALIAVSDAPLLAPLPQPRLILSHGAAYHSHALDWDPNAPRERPNHPPAGFIKGAHAVTGPDSPIFVPKAAPDFVDFEGEFCVVFGKACRNVSRSEAWDCVIGFTIINDVSARDWVPRGPDASEIPPHVRAAFGMLYKNFPSFCPMGPAIVTKDELHGVADFHLTTRLNGEVMQEAWTRDLIWDIPELIEHYSAIVGFEAGDVMSTGTPGGVGIGRKPPIFMKPGDVVSVSVDGVGTLQNALVAQP